jgi:hypothetical protein
MMYAGIPVLVLLGIVARGTTTLAAANPHAKE